MSGSKIGVTLVAIFYIIVIFLMVAVFLPEYMESKAKFKQAEKEYEEWMEDWKEWDAYIKSQQP